MRRTALPLLIAGLMLAFMAAPALATVHPLANSECANANAAAPATTQNPPGITDDGHEPGYVDRDPDKATEAQPILSVLKNPTATQNAFKAPPAACTAP